MPPTMADEKENGSSTPVLESTETDAIEVKVETPTVSDEQWRAMRTVIEALVNYRDAE